MFWSSSSGEDENVKSLHKDILEIEYKYLNTWGSNYGYLIDMKLEAMINHYLSLYFKVPPPKIQNRKREEYSSKLNVL